jgi:CRP-like cAMP-binding protein
MAPQRQRCGWQCTGNKLIDSLPAAAAAALLTRASRVNLEAEQVLYRPDGHRFRYVFFPVDSSIAIVQEMDNGMLAEFSSIGRHGMTGARTILGLDRPVRTALCSVAGTAYRLNLPAFLEELAQSRALSDTILRYNAAVMNSIGQYALCNRFHMPDQRCARWLSFVYDCTRRESLSLTHQFLGQLLGMRRPAVSSTLAVLETKGAITIGRRAITLRSRSKLHAAACECYHLIASEFKKVT